MILISPTEPLSVRAALDLAELEWMVSGRPEPMGVDFAWRVGGRWWGVQRKTVDDFLSSCYDGRLAKEVGQMRASVMLPMLVMEGRIDKWAGRVGPEEMAKRELSLMAAGVNIMRVRDASETVRYVQVMREWSQQTGHQTAINVPKAAGDWGKPTNTDWQAAVLMQLPGVGSKTARTIVKELGLPLRMSCTREELMAVRGVGKVMADRIWEAFGDRDSAI